MNFLMEEYKKETGKDAISSDAGFSPSLEYVEWLENHLVYIAKNFCKYAEKYSFYDKTSGFYYKVKELTGESFS